MRFIHAVAAAALTAVAAPAFAAPAAVSTAAVLVRSDVSDAEVDQFSAAMKGVMTVNAQVQNGAPTPEQQAAMAAAIEGAGLTIERFNAISGQLSSDDVLRARLAVADAPASPAGSVAADVTDVELEQFAKAMAGVGPIAAQLNGAAPTAEQQAAMSEAITGSGLSLERFNAISGATSQDARLRARIALAEAKAG